MSQPRRSAPDPTTPPQDTAAPATPIVPGHADGVHALVVGASRGIGRAIASLLAADPRVACLHLAARHATRDDTLRPLTAGRDAALIQLHDVDVTDLGSVASMAAAIAAASPRLHLVLNTAGLLHEPALAPEKSVRQVDPDALARSFAVNAAGPILLARELFPRLAHAEPAVFASLSARVGSIADNRLGGWYAYRAAKAAQNQLLKTFAIELHLPKPSPRTERSAIAQAL